MSEKWTPKIVGGTDLEELALAASEEAAISKPKNAPEVNSRELVVEWVRVMDEMPADFEKRYESERVKAAQANVRFWTVGELYAYLQRKNLEDSPSATKAVFNEISFRSQANNFAPMRD